MSEHIQIGDIRPRVQYAADGSQTAFPYPFAIFTTEDLHVYLDDSRATSGFSVSGVASSEGGTVTFAAPPGGGVRVTLLRQIDIQRVTDFQAGGPLRAATLNDALDYLTAVDQQLDDAVRRTVRLGPGAAETASLTLPPPEAGAVLGWDETASGLVNTFPDGATALLYATTAQGTLADSAVQPGSDVTLGTVDYTAARFKATAASVGATHTVILADGAYQAMTLTANTVLTLPSPPAGRGYSLTLKLVQDATGRRTPTIQQADATPTLWAGGAAPTWQTTSGQSDLVTLTHDGTDLIAEHVDVNASAVIPEPSAVSVIGIAQVSTGGGAGTWQRIDEDGNNLTGTEYDLGGSAYNGHAVWGNIADETVDGQAMVKIPAFYYKVGTAPTGSDQAGKKCWWIGSGPFDGATLHPAFRANGTNISHVWIGKYQGTNDGGTKLGSTTGVLPLVSTDFPIMQSMAASRNTGGVTGFMLWSCYQVAAIQMLALIEMGGSDSQTLIGTGRTAVETASTVDAPDVAQATYRGLVGLWGNVWQMVDGLKGSASNQIQIWDREGNKTWVDTATSVQQNGWILSVLDTANTTFDFRDFFLPASVDATEANATFADYTYGASDGVEHVAYHGGAWSNESTAGLFMSALCNTATGYAVVGGRLAKLP